MTINWYENYYFNKEPILKYTENQIDEFMKNLKNKTKMKIINFPLIENDDGSLVKILYENVTANIREIYPNNVFFKNKRLIFIKKANIYLCVVKGGRYFINKKRRNKRA